MIWILTCKCLRQRLFRVTLEISRTAPWYRDVTAGTLTATDTCIGYHVTRFETFQNVNIGTRYVCTCVGAGSGMGGGRRKTHVLLLCLSVIFLTCDMYKSGLRHIQDPVLSSLKMKGILFFLFTIWRVSQGFQTVTFHLVTIRIIIVTSHLRFMTKTWNISRLS
jgi:hypothetical protein